MSLLNKRPKYREFRKPKTEVQKCEVCIVISQHRSKHEPDNRPCTYHGTHRYHPTKLSGRSVKCTRYNEFDNKMVITLPKGDLRTVAKNALVIWRHMKDQLGKPLGYGSWGDNPLEGFYIDVDGWYSEFTKPSIAVRFEQWPDGVREDTYAHPTRPPKFKSRERKWFIHSSKIWKHWDGLRLFRSLDDIRHRPVGQRMVLDSVRLTNGKSLIRYLSL